MKLHPPEITTIVPQVLKHVFKDGWESIIDTNPDRLSQLVIEHEPRITRHAAILGDAVASILAAVTLIYSKVPIVTEPDYFGETKVPPKSEIDRFNDYLGAAMNPSKSLKNLKNMSASRIEIDVLKAVYPKQGGEVIHQVLEKAHNKAIPYKDRVWLSNLSEGSMLKSTDPQFTAKIQATFDRNNPATAQEDTEPKSTRKRSPQKISNINESDATYIARGGQDER